MSSEFIPFVGSCTFVNRFLKETAKDTQLLTLSVKSR